MYVFVSFDLSIRFSPLPSPFLYQYLTCFINYIVVSVNLVRAQDDAEDQEEETYEQERKQNPPRAFRETAELMNSTSLPSNGVRTSFKIIYARNSTEVQPGDIVTVLIGFENVGNTTYQVTDICAAMAAPNEPTNLIRNYSAFHHNITIQRNTIHTMEYSIRIDDKTNPFNYSLIVAIFYHDIFDNNEFTSIPYNSTFVVIDSPNHLDTRRFLVLLSLFVGAVIVVVYKRKIIIDYCTEIFKRLSRGEFNFSKISRTKKTTIKPKKPIRTGNPELDEKRTLERDEQDEWLPNSTTMKYIKQDRRKRAMSQSPARQASNKPRGRSP